VRTVGRCRELFPSYFVYLINWIYCFPFGSLSVGFKFVTRFKSSFHRGRVQLDAETSAKHNTVEPRFNGVAGDRPNLFVKSRVRYIENLDVTNLRGNDQNVSYIEVIVNDWFVTQVISVTQFNAIFVTKKCRILRCNSLSMVAFSINYFPFWGDAQLLFTKERHFQSSDLKMLQHRGYTENCQKLIDVEILL